MLILSLKMPILFWAKQVFSLKRGSFNFKCLLNANSVPATMTDFILKWFKLNSLKANTKNFQVKAEQK